MKFFDWLSELYDDRSSCSRGDEGVESRRNKSHLRLLFLPFCFLIHFLQMITAGLPLMLLIIQSLWRQVDLCIPQRYEHACNSLIYKPCFSEMARFREYESDRKNIADLSEEDQFLAHLVKIERLEHKVKIMSFMGTFEESADLLEPVKTFHCRFI